MNLDRNLNIDPPQIYIDIPEMEELDLTLSEIRELSDDDLLKLLTGESDKGFVAPPLLQVINNEYIRRQMELTSRPHWTILPTFIVACLAAVSSIVSLGISIYLLAGP
jgi:hypothetical protein